MFHFVLQRAGGVGKTMVSAILIQYFRRHRQPIAIDADPDNAHLSLFRGIGAERLDLLRRGVIDPERFDEFLELGRGSSPEEVFVVDSGGSGNFGHLATYVIENETFEELRAAGHEVLMHVPVTGGGSYEVSMGGLEAVAKFLSQSKDVVPWINPYHGRVCEGSGQKFEDLEVVQKMYENDQIFATVELPDFDPQTYGRTMQRVFAEKLTFFEAVKGDKLRVAARSRVHRWRSHIDRQLDQIFGRSSAVPIEEDVEKDVVSAS